MLKHRSDSVHEIHVLLKLLKNICGRNLRFDDLPDQDKKTVLGFLEAQGTDIPMKHFISLVHYLNVIRIGTDVLESYAWDQKIFAGLADNLHQFNALNVTSHLFDLAYIGFTWEDLVSRELAEPVLQRIKESKPTFYDASVLLQALEYMGAWKYPSPLLDVVLNDVLGHIKSTFSAFMRNKDTRNASFVLYRNFFNLQLDNHFSNNQQKLIRRIAEDSPEVRLKGHMVRIRDSACKWLNDHHIVAQKDFAIPKSGFMATIWLPENEVVVELSLGKASDDRYREKKKAILKAFGYQHFIVIDIHKWISSNAEQKLDAFYTEQFKTLLPQTSAEKNRVSQFNQGLKQGYSFSEVVKGKPKIASCENRVGQTAVDSKAAKPLLFSQGSMRIQSDAEKSYKTWSQDAESYKAIWGIDKIFFSESEEVFGSVHSNTIAQEEKISLQKHKY